MSTDDDKNFLPFEKLANKIASKYPELLEEPLVWNSAAMRQIHALYPKEDQEVLSNAINYLIWKRKWQY